MFALLRCCAVTLVLFGAFFLAPATADTSFEETRHQFRRPSSIPFPKDAPYSREIATLGKMLFFDPRLSKHQNMSCASCHNPSFGWEAPVARAIGTQNRPLSRHTPTVLNLAWGTSFFWDGRAQTLEEQAAGPLLAKSEMASDFELIAARLEGVPTYKDAFDRLFPYQGITRETVTRALATYERTLVAANAPFDSWVNGKDHAISPSAQRGFFLFTGIAGCGGCHSGWNFTDGNFYDVGADLALYAPVLTASNATDRPKLKVPTLRNIELRAPYMHLGSLKSLEEVVLHYADSGVSQNVDHLLDTAPFKASPKDVADIVSFLKTLTEVGTPVSAPVLPAQ